MNLMVCGKKQTNNAVKHFFLLLNLKTTNENESWKSIKDKFKRNQGRFNLLDKKPVWNIFFNLTHLLR